MKSDSRKRQIIETTRWNPKLIAMARMRGVGREFKDVNHTMTFTVLEEVQLRFVIIDSDNDKSVLKLRDSNTLEMAVENGPPLTYKRVVK